MLSCKSCGKETEKKCIQCSLPVCEDHLLTCDLLEFAEEYCSQKVGSIVAWRCSGIICKDCELDVLTYKCRNCGRRYCMSRSETFKCKTCKFTFCPECYDSHVKTCTDKYDRDAEMEIIREKIQKK
ncbi:MAG: hypothetical protein ACTSRW_14635 [Candidatus Helarchaeota archaeon]